MSQNEKKFDFSFIRNGSILIMWMSGELQRDAQACLDTCWHEAGGGADIKVVILDFSRLTAIGAEATPAFAKFQKQIRAEKIDLRICGINEELKERLFRKGVLRHAELVVSLKTALATLGQARNLSGVSQGAEKKAA
jgi:anti-anti-sigma regulatory factor